MFIAPGASDTKNTSHITHAGEGGGGSQISLPPLKNHKNIGFLSNTGLDRLNNHKAAKPAFNVGP